MAVPDFFDRGWHANPGAVAFVTAENSYTYQEIGELSCRVGHALHDAGLRRGDSVAVLSGNDPVAWACVLGIWRAGLVHVPLNPALPAAELQQQLNCFDCRALFYQQALAPLVETLRGELPKLGHLVGIDELPAWGASQLPTPPELPIRMDDVCGLAPTGGTTGRPKGVLNTHRSISTAMAHLMLTTHYPHGAPIVNLAATPMTHTAGLLTLPCSARGGTVAVLTRADPTGLLDAIERFRVTELFLPPTVIYRLLETPGIRERDLSSLRYLLYGAAPMSVKKLRQALDVFGPVMCGGYGQTEAPLAISALTPAEHYVDGQVADDRRLGSVGRPGPLVSVAVLDEVNQRVPTGQTGEICVRGDLVMAGYYRDQNQTNATITHGWLHTGDIGHLDENGYLTITDRKRDVIISGGFTVYPGPIEQVLWAHPAVRDCAVIGLPHPDWGEAVTAVVELGAGASATAEELVAWCKTRLGSVSCPKTVEFVEALPRSRANKVLKRGLRQRFDTVAQ